MTADEKKMIEQTIQDVMVTLKKQISHLEARSKPIPPDCSLGRLTRTEAMTQQEVDQKILGESRLRLTRLQNALTRIDKPIFGICIECEEEINIERMKIRPECVRCVECAKVGS
ncbi:MAG: TraR/DksA C4-type zinc finger protein [Campylobacterales bacterium]|nr:TraR/DksA C4-type zinc finger protein [Campylobacterales bacterium]